VKTEDFGLLVDRVRKLDDELDQANLAFRSFHKLVTDETDRMLASHEHHVHSFSWRSFSPPERWKVAWGVFWRILAAQAAVWLILFVVALIMVGAAASP
jgi:hypothetical protein